MRKTENHACRRCPRPEHEAFAVAVEQSQIPQRGAYLVSHRNLASAGMQFPEPICNAVGAGRL